MPNPPATGSGGMLHDDSLGFGGASANPEYPSFIEKLFLSLVLANPLGDLPEGSRVPDDPAGKRVWRVTQAARCLLGASVLPTGKKGPKPQPDLEIMFRAFATRNGVGPIRPRPEGVQPGEYSNAILDSNVLGINDPIEGETKDYAVKGRLKAALEAENGFATDADLQRVCKRFNEYQPYLIGLYNGMDGEYPREAAMLESLKVIAAELAKWGVKMELDVVRLRLAALWDEQA